MRRVKTYYFLSFLLLFFCFSFSSEIKHKDNTFIRIKAVGDIMPATSFPNLTEPPEKEKTYLFLAEYLKSDSPHFVFGNLEGAITTHAVSRKDTSKPNTFAFRIPPKYAFLLKELGFNVLSVANNHSLDFGIKGYEDTKRYLKEAGITPIGDKGKLEIFNVEGIKVGWLAFSWHDFFNNILNIEESMNLIRRASSECDVLIVSVHGGSEGDRALRVRDQMEYFGSEKRGNLVRFSHLAIENGADLILMHGPHVPRALELYKGKLIAYSLGNFITYQKFSTTGYKKLSYVLQVDLDREGNFLRGRIIPFIQEEKGPYKGVPRPDPERRVIYLLRKLSKEDFPNSPLTITDEGDILKER